MNTQNANDNIAVVRAVRPFAGEIEGMRHYEVTRARPQGGRGVENE